MRFQSAGMRRIGRGAAVWAFALLAGPALAEGDGVPATGAQADQAQPEAAPRFADEAQVSAPFRAAADTPVPYSELSSEDLALAAFGQEPSFIFAERAPGVTFTSDSGGYLGYSYLRLRGIDQTRINVTLDGVPLNEPEDQGVYFSNYPDFFEFVESVQLQRGAGTSANGVASYAGSVRCESPGLGAGRHSGVSLALGSFGTARASGEVSTGAKRGFSAYLRASHLTSDGYKYHSGNVSSSAFWSANWGSSASALRLIGFVGEQRNDLAWVGVPLEAIARDPRTNGDTPEEKDRFRQSLLAIRYSQAFGRRLVVSASSYASLLNGHYDFDLANFLGLPPTGELYRYSFASHFVGAFATAGYETERLELHGGLHANRYDRRHLGSERALGELYRNTGYRDELSGFAKAGVRFGRALLFGDVQVRSTGFRYDGAVAMSTLRWSFLNPRFGASYRLSPRVTAYASVGRTGREPTRNDLFGGADDLALGATGAPLLFAVPPERVVDSEAGLRVSTGRWRLEVNGYLMRFRDEIVLNGQLGPNGLALHSNVARSYRAGLEIDARWRLPLGLSLANRSAFGRSRIREGAAALAPVLSPSAIVNQELRFERRRYAVGLTGRYQGRSWVDFANSARLPAYFVLGGVLSARHAPWEASLRVQNLTNRRYFTNGALAPSGSPLYFVQALRNVLLELRWVH